MHALLPTLSLSVLLLASASPISRDGVASCDPNNFCSGVGNTSPGPYTCGNNLLGPVGLQNVRIRAGNILGQILDNYHPFAGTCPGAFLQKYSSGKRYRYPPADGFALKYDGEPVMKYLTLAPGTMLDRFGTDSGRFLSPFGTPYENRSLGPASLSSSPKYTDGTPYNFHVYRVLKDLTVQAVNMLS
ncbi:hypothetical protein NOR_08684 [Metarhizium rileyi]|uniref:TNT domain-containing protein n=1 Tax=Metarhizium rileyi (strain RCEF 4871) TaxID=1649241 RepID=A0A166VUW3_METRR|nr:hypothetical protein NOR_08684 [Metarhizium rileyi RCEF 4871]